MNIKEKIYDLMREVIPNELSDYFNIDIESGYTETEIKNFIEDIIIDIKDNL